ncbi:MAG: hypothetical protein M1825_004504 [Sarcosagium campestre]|nr:MAG: hypothetical protein M1825_004504 [Sarcosagium campestre]
MPPRKKQRLASRATPLQDSQTSAAATPTEVGTPSRRDLAYTEWLADPWTDAQELSLFKGIVRCKPAGMHKHFRMLALSQQVKAASKTPDADTHTNIPGIWRKLSSLYNLQAIDERETSFLDGDEDSQDHSSEPYHPFSLPQDEYGYEMFERRLAKDGSSSPSLLDRPTRPAVKRLGKGTRGGRRPTRASTVEDTEEGLFACNPGARRIDLLMDWCLAEPASSPMPTRAGPVKRTSRTVKPTAKSQKFNLTKAPPAGRKSKVASAAETEEEATGEEAEDEGGGSGDEDVDEDADDSAAPRVTRRGPKPGRGTAGKKRGSTGAITRKSARKK